MKLVLYVIIFFSCHLIWAQEKGSFSTKNGKIIDANNNEFIIRGINNPHIWNPEKAYHALDTIASYKSNSVRVVWGLNGGAEDFRKIIERIIDLKMVAIPEIHDPTGKNDIANLEEAARYWARDDIKAVLNDHKPFIILNIVNEWMASNDLKNWFKGYKSAIRIIRKAGLKHCLLVDGAGWGQDVSPAKKYASRLIKFDPFENLIFGVHMYGKWNDSTKIERELKYFTNNKIPILVGEFGYNFQDGNNNLNCQVNAAFLMRQCQELGIGYIPWSWTGNSKENRWLDMVENNDWKTLTYWGHLVLNSTFGIRNTAKTCSVFSKEVTLK